MTRLNGNTPKWIAVVASVAIACIGFAYGIGAKDISQVETRLDSACVRLRVVEQDSASLKTEIPAMKETLSDIKIELREIKRLLMER